MRSVSFPGLPSQSASVRALPYMEGVIYVRSDFLHAIEVLFSAPEEFLIPILWFYTGGGTGPAGPVLAGPLFSPHNYHRSGFDA